MRFVLHISLILPFPYRRVNYKKECKSRLELVLVIVIEKEKHHNINPILINF